MAKLNFLLQAAESGTHASEVRAMLGIAHPISVLISVAFVRQAGVAALAPALKIVAPKTRCFIGIRNDITSFQAVESLLATGVQVFAVDTASRHRVFHPKLYLAQSRNTACAVIGSANLTFNGLHNNIEASSLVKLKLADPDDANFVTKIVAAFDSLVAKHSQHVFEIAGLAHARQLFDEGRLADEAVLPRSPTVARVKPGVAPDDLPPMALATVKAPRPLKPAGQGNARVGFELVWKSGPLPRRSLQIPIGQKANKTGDIGLGKGAFLEIDQVTYFRADVFGRLQWTRAKTRKSFLERARADFELVVKNINCGTHSLEVTHDANPASNQALNDNHVTRLKWGAATSFIAREALLNRTLYLYRRIGSAPPSFLIEID